MEENKKFKAYLVQYMLISPFIAMLSNELAYNDQLINELHTVLGLSGLTQAQIRSTIYFLIGYLFVVPIYMFKFNACMGRKGLSTLGVADKILVTTLATVLPVCVIFFPFILVLTDVGQTGRAVVIQCILNSSTLELAISGAPILYGVTLMMWILCFRVIGLWKIN